MTEDPLSAKAEAAINAAIATLADIDGFSKAWAATDNETLIGMRSTLHTAAIRELNASTAEPDAADRIAQAIIADLSDRRGFRQEMLDPLFYDDEAMAKFAKERDIPSDLLAEDDSRTGVCRIIGRAIRLAVAA